MQPRKCSNAKPRPAKGRKGGSGKVGGTAGVCHLLSQCPPGLLESTPPPPPPPPPRPKTPNPSISQRLFYYLLKTKEVKIWKTKKKRTRRVRKWQSAEALATLLTIRPEHGHGWGFQGFQGFQGSRGGGGAFDPSWSAGCPTCRCDD